MALFPTTKLCILASIATIIFSGCSGDKQPQNTYQRGTTHYNNNRAVPSGAPNNGKLSNLYRSVNVKPEILPRGSRGRTGRSMRPLYITIHSTQNWSQGADALRHALALRRGALGRISWHYTTDMFRAVQHLPVTEQGNHAENYVGTGNKYSIGIEMCENPGNSRAQTVDKTARLAAYLMHKYNLPLSRVVPHYKWPRRGYAQPNKNCPHFLLDGGRPGRKWQGFLNQVNKYYRQAY